MIFFHHSQSNSRSVFGHAPNILHQPYSEPALSPVYRDELWWLGTGVYSRQVDGLWKHHDTRFTGRWQETLYIESWQQAEALALNVVNAEWEIDKALRTIGLEPIPLFSRIEKNQMLALCEIAERWHLMYCGSESVVKRHFQKSLLFYGFSWNYGD